MIILYFYKKAKVMRLITTSLFIFFIQAMLYAQMGQAFPNMETEALTNQIINVPEDIKGKYSIVGLAFTKKSEQDLKSWFNPIYETFLYKPENPGIFDITYDVNGLFIPMFSGAKRAAYGKVMKKMKEGLDPKLQPHVVFYKGTINHYKDALNFDGKDVPYFYVLDPDANIVYATSGKYTNGKMQEVVDAVQQAMKMD